MNAEMGCRRTTGEHGTVRDADDVPEVPGHADVRVASVHRVRGQGPDGAAQEDRRARTRRWVTFGLVSVLAQSMTQLQVQESRTVRRCGCRSARRKCSSRSAWKSRTTSGATAPTSTPTLTCRWRRPPSADRSASR